MSVWPCSLLPLLDWSLEPRARRSSSRSFARGESRWSSMSDRARGLGSAPQFNREALGALACVGRSPIPLPRRGARRAPEATSSSTPRGTSSTGRSPRPAVSSRASTRSSARPRDCEAGDDVQRGGPDRLPSAAARDSRAHVSSGVECDAHPGRGTSVRSRNSTEDRSPAGALRRGDSRGDLHNRFHTDDRARLLRPAEIVPASGA